MVVKCLILAVFGAIWGSFACCQAWRIHERGKRKLSQRSQCMHCAHKLRWYENIPVISYVCLRGKCRKCGKKIGKAEIITEIMMALGFVGAYLAVRWEIRLMWVLVLLVVMGILAVYDGKWGELPLVLLLLAIGVAGVVMLTGLEDWTQLGGIAASVMLTGGVYFLIAKLSREKLCGDGDWLLGVAIGLALGDWWLALLTLVVSNLMASIIGLAGRQKRVYFGPFFVIGFGVVFSLQEVLCIACLI